MVGFVSGAGGTEKEASGLGPSEVASVVTEGIGANMFDEFGGRGIGLFDGEEDRREERDQRNVGESEIFGSIDGK